jgi:hypothetical protein
MVVFAGDTWHLNLEDAKQPANFEFHGMITPWIPIPAQVKKNRSRLSPGRDQQSDVLWLKGPLHLTNNLIMSDQPDQKQPATMLAFQEALTQAIALWDETSVSVLDQQAVQTHALLLAMGKYITYRKDKGELESCPDGAEFINRLIKDL